MKAKLLADTCAWIDFFRGAGTHLVFALRAALTEGTVVCCDVVLYELLRGARSEKERRKLVDALDGLPCLELSREIWIKAGILASSQRSKGQTLPMSDVLIAVLALHHGAVVLTKDKHFNMVEGLSVQD